MSSDYPPPGPGPEPTDGPEPEDSPTPPPPPPPPPAAQPQWNPQSPGTPPPYGQPAYGQPVPGQPAYGQPVPGQQPYGQPPGYAPVGGFGQPQQTSPLAIVSLVLGLLGIPCCSIFVLGIAAVVTGLIARRQIDASQGRLKGNGMAMTGVVLGSLAVVVSLVYWILAGTGVIDTTFSTAP